MASKEIIICKWWPPRRSKGISKEVKMYGQMWGKTTCMKDGRDVRNLRSLPLQLMPRKSLSMLELTIML